MVGGERESRGSRKKVLQWEYLRQISFVETEVVSPVAILRKGGQCKIHTPFAPLFMEMVRLYMSRERGKSVIAVATVR